MGIFDKPKAKLAVNLIEKWMLLAEIMLNKDKYLQENFRDSLGFAL